MPFINPRLAVNAAGVGIKNVFVAGFARFAAYRFEMRHGLNRMRIMAA